MKLRVDRWRCRNENCDRRIFAVGAGMLTVPPAQRTQRAAEMCGYSVTPPEGASREAADAFQHADERRHCPAPSYGVRPLALRLNRA